MSEQHADTVRFSMDSAHKSPDMLTDHLRKEHLISTNSGHELAFDDSHCPACGHFAYAIARYDFIGNRSDAMPAVTCPYGDA